MRLNTYITYKKLYDENKQKDLIFYNNSLNIINLYCYDEDNELVDITGATISFIVKENPTDEDTAAVINKTVINLTNPINGYTEIEITLSDGENLVGNYIYELRIALVESGYEYILVQGNLCFRRSIYGISGI